MECACHRNDESLPRAPHAASRSRRPAVAPRGFLLLPFALLFVTSCCAGCSAFITPSYHHRPVSSMGSGRFHRRTLHSNDGLSSESGGERLKWRRLNAARLPSRYSGYRTAVKPSSSARQIFKRALVPISSMLAIVVKARPTIAAPSLSVVRRIRPTKSQFSLAKRIFLSLWLASACLQSIRVGRRQAADPTSEWGRYAQYPGARGRALGWLLMRVTVVWAVSHLVAQRHLLRYSGNLLADGLLKIGPLYIKLGQIVSCRDDVLPEPWIKSLERLQDQVPSKKGAQALELAHSAWASISGGKNTKQDFEDTFEEFDTTPIAAASLGQVHRAKLRRSGEQVAVKLQRAHLRRIYDQDLALLKGIAKSVDKLASYRKNADNVAQSWTDIFSDAETILYREIDYRDEAENGARFCQDFGIALGGKPSEILITKAKDGSPLPSAASWLRAPYVYTDLCSEKVLVMELVPSIKVTDTAKLDAYNVTLEDREYLADMLGRSYLRQFCCNLFFSTDPHPGNLGIEVKNSDALKPSERVRLVFYDFGQAASLTLRQADGILTIIDAIVDMDVDRSIEAFEQMGVLKEGADLKKVRAKVAENYKTGKITTNRKRITKRQGERGQTRESTRAETCDSVATSTDEPTKDSEVMRYFTLPTEYAFVGRALSQMGGVGKTLDPDFDFISSAAPWIYEVKGPGKFLRESAQKWFGSALEKFEALVAGNTGLNNEIESN